MVAAAVDQYLAQSGDYFFREVQIRDASNTNVAIRITPQAGRYAWTKIWDNRVTKKIKTWKNQSIEGSFDLFNTFNVNTITGQTNRVGSAAFLQPNHPTAEFGSWLFPELPSWLPFLGGLRRSSYRVTWYVLYRLIRDANDAARRRVLGLEPGANPFKAMLRERWPVLYGLSSSVVPRPADWGSELAMTGYWFLDGAQKWTPPRALEQFLAVGPKPICVGFGSMPSADPEQTTRLFARALALSGQRGVLLTGWGGLASAQLPENVFALESAPHDWSALFLNDELGAGELRRGRANRRRDRRDNAARIQAARG